MTKMEQIRAAKAEYENKAAELGKEAVAEELKALFDTYPELKAVRWNQYTPYFNDGDPCEFGLNGVTFKTREMSAEESTQDDEDDDFKNVAYDAGNAMHLAVKEFSRGRVEDIYKECFGDHVQVTATRDGVEVEEYSHD